MTQRKKEKKEYLKMTNGVNGIGGNPYSYGNYGYNNNQAKESQEQTPEAVNAPEQKAVNPEAVMDFMNRYIYMAPEAQSAGTGKVDPETQKRIEGFMEQFQIFYNIVEKEFGSELAPTVMDMIMDKLMVLS